MLRLHHRLLVLILLPCPRFYLRQVSPVRRLLRICRLLQVLPSHRVSCLPIHTRNNLPLHNHQRLSPCLKLQRIFPHCSRVCFQQISTSTICHRQILPRSCHLLLRNIPLFNLLMHRHLRRRRDKVIGLPSRLQVRSKPLLLYPPTRSRRIRHKCRKRRRRRRRRRCRLQLMPLQHNQQCPSLMRVYYLRPVRLLVPLPLFQLQQPGQVCLHPINFLTILRTNRAKIQQSDLPDSQRQQVRRLRVSHPASRAPFLLPTPFTSLLHCQYSPPLNHLLIFPFQSSLPFLHPMHQLCLDSLPCLCSLHFHHLSPQLCPRNLHFLPLMNQASLICLLLCPLLSQLFLYNHQIPHLICLPCRGSPQALPLQSQRSHINVLLFPLVYLPFQGNLHSLPLLGQPCQQFHLLLLL